VGDLTRAWNRLGPVIEAKVRAQIFPAATCPVALILQEDFGVYC
jgi:hypothetical protein